MLIPAAATLADIEAGAVVTRGSGVERKLDPESRAWLTALRGEGDVRRQAVDRLHEVLLRAARFEAARRRGSLPHLRGGEFEEVVLESAGDALVAVLARLDEFRGASRFTTWAYKFAVLETAVKLRRRSWQARELPLAPESWEIVADLHYSPEVEAEQNEFMAALREAIATALTPHQREVLVAIALNGVPIDVLAERLTTTRGALYKTVHDARQKLRAALAAAGLEPEAASGGKP